MALSNENLSKEEKRRLKEQHREQKRLHKEQKESIKIESAIPTISLERNVVCLKHGTKYSADYVNKLYSMCKRHLTLEHNFICFTEDPKGLNPNIKIKELPKDVPVQGWWYKPYIFCANNGLVGDVLFMDLDIVIIDNIDCFFTHQINKFCIIRDFTRAQMPQWQKYNSSVFRLRAGSLPYVWNKIKEDPKHTKRFHGDQDWLYDQIKNAEFWPDDWCQSYKWEVRERTDLLLLNGKRQFKDIKNPEIKSGTKILVFHGDPKPSEVKDPVVVDNWK